MLYNMLLRIYIIITLLIFFLMTLSGSAIEHALVKSTVAYTALLLLTRITKRILEIIRESPISNDDAETGRQNAHR